MEKRFGVSLTISVLVHLLAILIAPFSMREPVRALRGDTDTNAGGSGFDAPARIRVVDLIEVGGDALTEEAAEIVAAEKTAVDIGEALRRLSAAYAGDASSRTAGALRGGDRSGLSRGDPSYRPPVLLSLRWPEYPRDAPEPARALTVEVEVEVAPDGTVDHVVVLSGTSSESLDRAAIEAARSARFRPAQRGGVAVPARVTLPISFVAR